MSLLPIAVQGTAGPRTNPRDLPEALLRRSKRSCVKKKSKTKQAPPPLCHRRNKILSRIALVGRVTLWTYDNPQITIAPFLPLPTSEPAEYWMKQMPRATTDIQLAMLDYAAAWKSLDQVKAVAGASKHTFQGAAKRHNAKSIARVKVHLYNEFLSQAMPDAWEMSEDCSVPWPCKTLQLRELDDMDVPTFAWKSVIGRHRYIASRRLRRMYFVIMLHCLPYEVLPQLILRGGDVDFADAIEVDADEVIWDFRAHRCKLGQDIIENRDEAVATLKKEAARWRQVVREELGTLQSEEEEGAAVDILRGLQTAAHILKRKFAFQLKEESFGWERNGGFTGTDVGRSSIVPRD